MKGKIGALAELAVFIDEFRIVPSPNLILNLRRSTNVLHERFSAARYVT